jgi:drug/metabolite transporter (DMT)-like permease
MTYKQFLLLLIPSALWGSSFIFMHELSPIFGPVLTATLRIVFASIFLFIIFTITKYKTNFKRDWKLFLLIGLGNSAVPFTLYAYAALYLDSSISVILNSTSPMFGALFGFLILRDKLTWNTYIGLILGTIGVGFVSSFAYIETEIEIYLSIFAALGAASLYGLTGAYVKKYAQHIEPKQLTFGTLTFAGIFLLILYGILFAFQAVPAIESTNLLRDFGLVILFGILCTATPYIIYYKLLQDVGPVNALMVTYLMPVFGIIWGVIFDEPITVMMMFGLLIILLGIYVLNVKRKKKDA